MTRDEITDVCAAGWRGSSRVPGHEHLPSITTVWTYLDWQRCTIEPRLHLMTSAAPENSWASTRTKTRSGSDLCAHTFLRKPRSELDGEPQKATKLHSSTFSLFFPGPLSASPLARMARRQSGHKQESKQGNSAHRSARCRAVSAPGSSPLHHTWIKYIFEVGRRLKMVIFNKLFKGSLYFVTV